MSYRITDRAEADLLEIWEWIAEDSPVNANRFIDELLERIPTLVDQPEIGFTRPYMPPGVRAFPHRSYLIFYRPTKDRIVIERVLHGARDMPGQFTAE